MPSLDLIRASLEGPIEWRNFESLVCELLKDDDMPSLRQLGGVADQGADAIEEAFYNNERQTTSIVQITSEQAQRTKLKKTIKRLREAKIEFDRLTIVYRDPVSSTVRAEIQKHAQEEGITVDLRDQTYLLPHLARPNGIYLRYFEEPQKQVERLFNEGDPLAYADDRLMHSLLASLSSYVANAAARLVRTTLFDRTALAALVSVGETDVEKLKGHICKLLPGETVDSAQLNAALERLAGEDLCVLDGTKVRPSDLAFESLGTSLQSIRNAFSQMLRQLVDDVNARHKLNDAQKGRLERNLKAALTRLVRLVKPCDTLSADAASELKQGERGFREILGDGLPDDVSRVAISSLLDFVRAPLNADSLALLARSYASIGLRNMDPLGRRWQAANLSRSKILLDTDAVLYTLIEELPESPSLVKALNGLSKEGIKFVVPTSVLSEVVGHLSRADKTYRRFGAGLHRLNDEAVDADVWHAIVRGFYYAKAGSTESDFQAYKAKYFDANDPVSFTSFLLGKRLPCELQVDLIVHSADQTAHDDLVETLAHGEEHGRLKATFRDDYQMRERAEDHVACALYAARLSSGSISAAPLGYIASNDHVFRVIQQNPLWGTRSNVHMDIASLLTLAEWVAGTRLTDAELVSVVFEPVLAAAANDIADEIVELARVGVEVKGIDMRRLEWDLRQKMQSSLFQPSNKESIQTGQDRFKDRIELAGAATKAGYVVDPVVLQIVGEYERLVSDVRTEKEKRRLGQKIIGELVKSGAGASEKGRRRIRAAIRDLGGESFLDNEAEGDDTKELE